MSMLSASARTSSDVSHDCERPPYAEERARRAAARQELVLRRSGLECGTENAHRYDLIYERYNQPVGINLTLGEVEAWLGIRTT